MDITIRGIKHYGAHLMSHEKKEVRVKEALLPFYLPVDFIPASQQCRRTEKILSQSCFTVITLKFLCDNTWIIYGAKVIVNPVQPASSLVEAEKFTN